MLERVAGALEYVDGPLRNEGIRKNKKLTLAKLNSYTVAENAVDDFIFKIIFKMISFEYLVHIQDIASCFFFAVAIRTAPERGLRFAIRTGVQNFRKFSMLFFTFVDPRYYMFV